MLSLPLTECTGRAEVWDGEGGGVGGRAGG